MRVAHFIQRYPPALGGAESYFARLSEYLAARGDGVSVFTSNAIDLTAFWSRAGATVPPGVTTSNGVEVRRYALWRCPGRRYFLKALSFLPARRWQCLTMPCNPISWSLWRDCGRTPERFDAVHASAFPYAFPIVCALRLARRTGAPFFLTPFLHLGDPEDPRDATRRAYTAPPLRWLLRQADFVFAQTELERDALLGLGLPAANVVLQGLGVDPAECTGGDRAAARARWQAAGDEVVVGHLANNSEEKGTADLLRAAELLWRQGERFRVVLAGPEMPNFRRFWAGFGPKDRVTRLGVLTEQGKRDFFAGIDLFALPSRSDSFGLVLLEAWANGAPNLAYRAGGIAGVVRDGEDGLLTKCGGVNALAGALARLVADGSLRRRLGEAGKQRALRDYRWEDKLDLVRRCYQDSAQAPRKARGPVLRGPGLLRA